MSEPNNNETCCIDQPKTASDFFMLFSMGSVLFGLVIFCVGYLVPRDHAKDASLTAREQETIAIHNANEANTLDICVVVGMCFIGLGGVVTSAVFCGSVVCGDCGSRMVGDDSIMLTPEQRAGSRQDQRYGAMEEMAEAGQR